jgi:lipid A disaccharide synthetase
LNEKNIVAELTKLLTENEKSIQLKKDYEVLYNLLAEGGHASANAAEKIYSLIKN